MRIYYENKEIEHLVKDKDAFIKKFDNDVYNNYIRFTEELAPANNLLIASMLLKSRRIRKMEGFKKRYEARLNDKYRVEFNIDDGLNAVEVVDIYVIKVHPHKYSRSR